ncbi:MAG: flagellar assembly protein FliW [Nitrospira sp.]|nr:flagellar assembly protein FliW [Nitrospira sp.]MCP9463265.1 flagellar assembly protein FliW [Nitrospira sp.]
MKCSSSRFGTFEITEGQVLTFPSGLLGFPDHRRYVILDHDTEAPFQWLQSLDEGGLAFVILDPDLFLGEEYRIEVSDETLAEIHGKRGEPLSVAVILTIPSDDPRRITANLRGPLVMNPRTRLGKQVILSEEYPTRHPLFPLPAPAVAEPAKAVASQTCS